MTKNPILNALAAFVYIVIITLVMFFGVENSGEDQEIITPIAILSLFTLSAAVMGYLFCYEPLQLFLDGKKKEGVNLFLKTVAVFGGITAITLLLLFTGVFSNLLK